MSVLYWQVASEKSAKEADKNAGYSNNKCNPKMSAVEWASSQNSCNLKEWRPPATHNQNYACAAVPQGTRDYAQFLAATRQAYLA